MLDRLFTSFLRMMVKIIRVFIPKPKLGEVDLTKIDQDKR